MCRGTGHKKERQSIPSPVSRLQRMFSIALNSDMVSDFLLAGPDDQSACGYCVACGDDASKTPLMQCASCLLWWHTGCAKKVTSYIGGFAEAHTVQRLRDVELEIGELPFLFLPRA